MTVAAREFAAPEPDAEIIGQSVREPECFAAVFDRYYATIHGYVARRLGPSLADDLASETFLTAFAARDRYDLARADAPGHTCSGSRRTSSLGITGPSSGGTGRWRGPASTRSTNYRGTTKVLTAGWTDDLPEIIPHR